jgi:hypothetical protein
MSRGLDGINLRAERAQLLGGPYHTIWCTYRLCM